MRTGSRWCAGACLALVAASSSAVEATLVRDIVVVDDTIPAPLTATAGDVERGRTIVGDRHVGLCLLCHSGPFPDERSQGTLAPNLSGAGSRWTVAQLRLRIVDARRLNPATPMPAYHRVDDDAVRVGDAYRGKPVLDAQQVEDVVAYLATLR